MLNRKKSLALISRGFFCDLRPGLWSCCTHSSVGEPVLMSDSLQVTRRQPALAQADVRHCSVLPPLASCVCLLTHQTLCSADSMPGSGLGAARTASREGPQSCPPGVTFQVRDENGATPAGLVRCHLCWMSGGDPECSGEWLLPLGKLGRAGDSRTGPGPWPTQVLIGPIALNWIGFG